MNRKVYDNGRANAAGVSKKRKLSNKRGFTLAETLLAVLILLLVSVVVATGMPAATNAYNKVILGANAKVILTPKGSLPEGAGTRSVTEGVYAEL